MDEKQAQMYFGKYTVQQNLARAVAEKRLTLLADGRYALPQQGGGCNQLQIRNAPDLTCQIYTRLFFQIAYDETAVPYSCRNCYKVKVVPANFSGLIALRDILEDSPYIAKCGVNLPGMYSRDVYSGHLYLNGLEAARDACRDMQNRINAHADMAGNTVLSIKRGCTHFEAVCGPSDRWTFRDGMCEIEESLKAQCHSLPHPSSDYRQRRMASMPIWLQTAYSIKDDSYLKFTGGKPLYRPTVSYPLTEPTSDEKPDSADS